MFSFPGKLYDLAMVIDEWVRSAIEGLSWELGAKTTDVYIEASATVSLAADSVLVGKEAGLFTLTAAQVTLIDYIGFMGSLSLFLSSVKGIKKHGHAFWNEEIGSAPFKVALMRMTGKVLLVALSLFGMVAFAYGSVVNRITLMSISTFLLLISLFTHYYEKVYCKECSDSSKVTQSFSIKS